MVKRECCDTPVVTAHRAASASFQDQLLLATLPGADDLLGPTTDTTPSPFAPSHELDFSVQSTIAEATGAGSDIVLSATH